MMTICIYTPLCVPLVSIGDYIADYLTGRAGKSRLSFWQDARHV